MKSLEFLDNLMKEPLIVAEDIEVVDNQIVKKSVADSLCEFVDELFSTIFMKSYFETIKKNN